MEKESFEAMENSLVPTFTNELYITNAEYQGCFIKIWANFYSKKRANMEKHFQDYKTFTKEFTKLDLYGNTLYVYIWKTDCDIRVYRCQVVCSDLVAKTHTILLIDYGRKMIVSYFDVREVTKDIDHTLLIGFSQKATVQTFLLSGYISKPKTNNELINILCNKYYKYRRDFDVNGVTFISLFGIDKKLTDYGIATTIDMTAMITIAKNMSSLIVLNNVNDAINTYALPSNASTVCSFPKSQHLDYVTLIDIYITKVSIGNHSILLTVRTLDHDTETITDLLNSLDRQNLKLTPILQVYTPCLIILRNELVRAIILEVKYDGLYIDLIDYGIREMIPRTVVFEIPSKCNSIEMRSMNVVCDKPNNVKLDENMFVQKYFQMLPLKIDPNFGLYKVKLLKKNNVDAIDVSNTIDIGQCSISSKSPDFFSITEINEEITSIENIMNNNSEVSINRINKIKINTGMKENEILNLIEKDVIYLKEKNNDKLNEIECINSITPIMFLRRENLLKDNQEIISSIIFYKSPYNFRMRQHNPNFKPFMDQIKSTLGTRHILTKCELVKNMYVIYQHQIDSIYRAQIIDMDSEVEKIKLQLVDERNEITNENFNNITLYNFIETDCNIPTQLVLDCSLSNMWFPVLNEDTQLMLQPYFNKKILYKVYIVRTDESGLNLVQLIEKDTNIDISNIILESGIGQRLCAAMKTDENPYEENLFKGQSFLAYIYHYHFNICIQPEPNIVDELEEEILEYVEHNIIPEELDISNLQNKYCLATVNNEQWYRADIKNINEESVIVNMFDIGLLTNVSVKQIRPIPNNLMRKPQLCLHCSLENKDLSFKITEKTLYNVIVTSINTDGKLCIVVKEHNTAPLSNPIVRGIEKISFVHVDGDLTYLQRSQDKLNLEKMSEALSKLNGQLESKSSIIVGDVNIFESHGKLYRCVVKSISSKMAVVHCIDFGFEKQVEKKKLQYLGNSKIALLPALVIIVKTFPMAFNISKTIFLANMHVDDDGTLNVMLNSMDSIYSQNKLIETLRNGCLVKVTSVYANNDCWVVPDLFSDTLKNISDILIKMQSKIIPAVTEIGSLCAALHEETKKWHRALILDVDSENKNILSIDTGERFRAVKTTKLVSEIQKIPNCALRCQVMNNVNVKQLLNKYVNCKLISYTQPLLEVELFSDINDIQNYEITSQLAEECLVTISRFESFNEFYVKKVDDAEMTINHPKNCKQWPTVGTLVTALTDKGDGIWYKAEVLASNDNIHIIVRIISDGSICKSTEFKVITEDLVDNKLYYCCCLNEEIEDINLNDQNNLDIISDIMMTANWTMKIFNDQEPYKVSLTSNGESCVDIVYRILAIYENDDLSEECNSVKSVESVKTSMESLIINNDRKMSIDNDLFLPEVETVNIKYVETFHNFYAESESLSMLYMQQINSDLDMSIIELSIDYNMVGSIVVTSSLELKSWCRAKVEKIQSDGVSAYCYLLDFGIYEECTKFYKATNFLQACPPIVRRCSLYTPKLNGKENEIWYPNVDDMFKDILTIEHVKFEMIIKENNDPYIVTLRLVDADVCDMLYPIKVKVSYVNSLIDFKVIAISSKQKALTEFLKSNVPLVIEEDPVIGNLYLAKIESKLKRVKFDLISGVKFVVFDIDDTLEALSVDNLYKIPENIANIPIFVMACSLILKNSEEIYSLSMFQRIANLNLTFTMCIITESDGQNLNLVKLYIGNNDILDIIENKFPN